MARSKDHKLLPLLFFLRLPQDIIARHASGCPRLSLQLVENLSFDAYSPERLTHPYQGSLLSSTSFCLGGEVLTRDGRQPLASRPQADVPNPAVTLMSGRQGERIFVAAEAPEGC